MAPPSQRSLQRRRYNAVPYVAGGRQTIEMDREGVIHKLDLDLSYTLTNGGGGAPTGALRNWPARLIARIEVIVAGRDTVWSISGADLAEMLLLENRDILPGISQAITAGGGATTAVRLLLPLRFTLPDARRYDDCALDTRGVGSITLVITWAGAMTELFGTTNSCAVSGVSLQVEADHMVNPAARPYLVRAIDTTESPIVGNSDNFGVEVDKGTGLVYRSLTLVTTNDNIAVSTVLDSGKVSLESGNYVFENRGGYVLRAENQFNLRRAAMRDGVYHLNFDQDDGSLSTAINTAGMDSTLKFILGVTKSAGVCVISTIREAVRPLKLG